MSYVSIGLVSIKSQFSGENMRQLSIWTLALGLAVAIPATSFAQDSTKKEEKKDGKKDEKKDEKKKPA